MKFVVLFLTLLVSLAFSSVCKVDFDETVCADFELSPQIALNSSTNLLTIKNAKGTITKRNLSKLKLVTEIKIVRSELAGIEPGALCSVSNLTSISMIDNKKIPKIGGATLRGCQQLNKIYLDGPIVVENGAFAEADHLQTVTLNNTILPCVLEKATFRGLQSLRSLTISHCQISGLKEDALEDLKNLKFLELQSNQIENIVPGTFKKLQALKVLNLSGNKLKLTWGEFGGLTSLKVLFLERNAFTHVAVDKLVADLPNLERIFLTRDKLTPENIKQIEDTLPNCNITVIFVN